jgi:uncharacterized protein
VPDLLLLFLKWPEPGLAKTRLIQALGPETAAAVYRLLAEAEVAATRPEAGEYDRLFCFSPANAEARVRAWFPGEGVWAQPEGDLGQRMAKAFQEAFARGATRVALIGTDIPWVTRDLVALSFEALASADVVLGPTHDGGYYLVAMARPLPGLFEGIEWSTSSVLAATRERAEALGLVTRLAPLLTDIDTFDDLRATWDELEPLLGREPAVRDAVAQAIAQRPGGPRFGAQ